MTKKKAIFSIFSVPMAFSGHRGVIQRNAVRSWRALGDDVRIILLGDDKGVAEVAAEIHALHIPDIERNQFGTPTVASAFGLAQEAACGDVMVFVNADIILTPDVVQIVGRLEMSSFLVVSERWNLDVQEQLDFSQPDWSRALKGRVLHEGQPHGPTGMDFFAFPRGQYRNPPPFGIGRAGWDSWLLCWSRRNGIPVVDASGTFQVVHQKHDYGHHPLGEAGVHGGPEAEYNLRLAGGANYIFTIEDADWLFDERGLRRAPLNGRRVFRMIRALPALHPALRPFLGPVYNMGRRIAKTLSGKTGHNLFSPRTPH